MPKTSTIKINVTVVVTKGMDTDELLDDLQVVCLKYACYDHQYQFAINIEEVDNA